MKALRIAAATAAAAFLMSGSSARADDITASKLQGWLDQGDEPREMALVALNSYAQAFVVANSFVKTKGQPRMICQPQKLAIAAEQSARILADYLKRRPDTASLPAPIVLLIALEDTFPCAPD